MRLVVARPSGARGRLRLAELLQQREQQERVEAEALDRPDEARREAQVALPLAVRRDLELRARDGRLGMGTCLMST